MSTILTECVCLQKKCKHSPSQAISHPLLSERGLDKLNLSYMSHFALYRVSSHIPSHPHTLTHTSHIPHTPSHTLTHTPHTPSTPSHTPQSWLLQRSHNRHGTSCTSTSSILQASSLPAPHAPRTQSQFDQTFPGRFLQVLLPPLTLCTGS